MLDFFNHPDRISLLPLVHHMEHGIKVTKDRVITHKYNFGFICNDQSRQKLKRCLESVGYNRDTINDILHNIDVTKCTYYGFGVENDKVEFYIEYNLNQIAFIKSWDLSLQVSYTYQQFDNNSAYNMLKGHTNANMFTLLSKLLDSIQITYKKNTDDHFSFYFKQKNPAKVSEIKGELLQLLSQVNNNSIINRYIDVYSNWYLYWLHISKKRDGGFQITPYFRSKI